MGEKLTPTVLKQSKIAYILIVRKICAFQCYPLKTLKKTLLHDTDFCTSRAYISLADIFAEAMYFY